MLHAYYYISIPNLEFGLPNAIILMSCLNQFILTMQLHSD